MEESSYFEQIEAYLEQRMSVADRRAFEQKMEQNAQLRKEFDAYQAALSALEMLAEDSLEGEEEKKSATIHILLWRGVAAVLVLGLLGLFLYANGRFTDHRLAANFYNVPMVDQIQRGNGDNLPAAWLAFGRQQYQQTINIFENTSDSLTNQDRFFQAHAYYQLGYFNQALSTAQKIETNTSDIILVDNTWLIILIHLNKGETAIAKEQLEAIRAMPNHFRKKDAETLLRQLESPWRKLLLH